MYIGYFFIVFFEQKIDSFKFLNLKKKVAAIKDLKFLKPFKNLKIYFDITS